MQQENKHFTDHFYYANFPALFIGSLHCGKHIHIFVNAKGY